jgi:ABC-2 type transport system permease protein
MRQRIVAIMKVELLRQFTTPLVYVMGFFLSALSGYFLIVLGRSFIELTLKFGANPEAANLHFHERIIAPLVLNIEYLFVLMIPLLCMRTLASERAQGSFELLAASLVRPWELILGKFLALTVVVVALCGVVCLEPLILAAIAEPGSAFDFGALATAMIGLGLLGCAFAAVGLAASALTESPALAAGGSFLFLLFAWVLRVGGQGEGFWGQLLPALSPLTRLENFAIGRLSAADIGYFLVLIALALTVALRGVDRHRWQG